MEGETTINGVMCVELKQRKCIDSFLSEGGDENIHLLYMEAMLVWGNILS